MTTCIGTFSNNSTKALYADRRIVDCNGQLLGSMNKIIEVVPEQFAIAVSGSASVITAIRSLVATEDEIKEIGVPETATDVYDFAQTVVEHLPRYGITIPETVPAQDMHCMMLALTPYGLWTVPNDRSVIDLNDCDRGYSNFMVIGSGRKYATGVMHIKGDPELAIDVASQYDYATSRQYDNWHCAGTPIL